MGYTTTFHGSFKLDRELEPEHAAYIGCLIEGPEQEDAPDSYCRWVPTKQRDGIEWDGGEKFYYYTEWLQWLIDHPLKRWGYTLSGAVSWQGEEVGDTGTLSIVDGKAVAERFAPATSSERIAGLVGVLQAIVGVVAVQVKNQPAFEEIRDLAAYGMERDDALAAGKKFVVFDEWKQAADR
jgi:hypothetical protein